MFHQRAAPSPEKKRNAGHRDGTQTTRSLALPNESGPPSGRAFKYFWLLDRSRPLGLNMAMPSPERPCSSNGCTPTSRSRVYFVLVVCVSLYTAPRLVIHGRVVLLFFTARPFACAAV